MSMVVKNNLSAINTLNTLNRNQTELSKSLQQVSSGMRINSAKDDTSGYAISERMRVQIRSLNQDNMNTQNGNSMMRVAEGAVQSTVDILKTLKEKVIDAANDTNTDADRAFIQKELDQSIDQINDNANVTYNGKYLVDGSKRGKGIATFNALSNDSFSTNTSAGTALTMLEDRNGNNLGILESDNVTVSYVQNGKTYTTSYRVGSTSLQYIFKAAEAIDKDTWAFADQNNLAIAKVTGVEDPAELARQAGLAQAWVSRTSNISLAAAGLYGNYSSLVRNLSSTLSTLTSAMSVATSDPAVIPTIGTAIVEDAQKEYTNSWRPSVGYTSEDGATYPDPSPSTISSHANLNVLLAQAASRASQFASLDALNKAFNAYKTAYTELNTFLTNNPLSGVTTDTPPEVPLLASNPYPLGTAGYDTSKYSKYASSAAEIATEAYNFYDSLSGPKLLDGAKIGVSRSDEIVYTANNENAITVTAMSSGTAGQISGFTVSVSDSEGKIKKSVNAVLDAWNETIRGENEEVEDTAIVLQVGTRANQAIKIGLSDMRAVALGLQGTDGSTLNIRTQQQATAAINVLDTAIQKALDQQTTIGAVQSRLEYTSTNLVTAIENVEASESVIRDADMAQAMTEYTKNNVLLQAAQSMLAQANQNSIQVLSLLR
jgi:flagellin